MQRIAVLTPGGRDADVVARILDGAGLSSAVQAGLDAVVDRLEAGEVGALVVAEEALQRDAARLHDWLARQPPWSDLPIILLTRRRDIANIPVPAPVALGNVTMLERPLQPVILVAAARAALRARARQHEAEAHIRDLAAERRALAESEVRYRTLFEAIDEGFCIIEFIDSPHGPLTDFVHLEANPAFEHHAGLKNIVGRKMRDVDPGDADAWIRQLRQVLDTGRPIRFERELAATGRHLELTASRVAGDRPQVAVLFQDRTDRVRAERKLRELNETLEQRVAAAVQGKKLFAELVEGTDSFVQVADCDFRWLAINGAAKNEFERIFGVRPAVGGSMLAALDHVPEQRAILRDLWSRALAGEEFTIIDEFGEATRDRRSYEIKFNTLRDPSGAVIGAYQFVQDVTERLRDQERLNEATARVHEMAKLETLGQLTGGVAHDFNNLLTPIVGALDMLSRKEIDERSARLLAGASQSAERASTLVQRLLTFARRQHLEARAVDVGALVGGMADLIERSLGPQIPISLRIADGLPAAWIDPNQLELAVLNLAVNARDAMEGGGQLEIVVDEEVVGPGSARLVPPGHYIRVCVADSGEGMDEETLRRAIEPFFTTKGVGKGTGLGLSMVHGLAAQSDGALELSSVPGQGTTAEMLLAVTSERVVEHRAPEPCDVRQPRAAAILLVDDEKLVRIATAEMLRDMGHDVTTAASPAEALGHLKGDTPFDLLISDYLMPQMRGGALIERALTLRPGLKALLITGYSNLAEGEAIAAARLAKPFREADLAREVAVLLSDTVVNLRGDHRSS